MAFDQTFIAIRKRSILEIFDLSLHVVRDHLAPLAVLWLAGVIPFMLADWIATRWMSEASLDGGQMALYCATTTLLIISQAQVATLPLTSYLGQAMFTQRPSIRQSLLSATGHWPRIIWLHGMLRLVVPIFAVVCLFNGQQLRDGVAALYVPFVGMVILAGWIRCLRPFVNEILLLEKPPARRRPGGPVDYAARSASLHRAARRELTARFLVLSLMCVPLFATSVGSLLLMDATLNLHDRGDVSSLVLYWPLACWLVVGLMAVIRYLSYVDIRIRQEGWEIELRMRAEAIRLKHCLGIDAS